MTKGSVSKKKRDDSISFSEFFQMLRDERGGQNARMKARIKARIKDLMVPRRPSTIEEAERRLAEIEDWHQLLNGLPADRPTLYVRKLRADNRTLTWKELLKRADPAELGSMSEGRFRNIAGGARRK